MSSICSTLKLSCELDSSIFTLKPQRKHTFDLSKLNYKENNVEIIKNDLEILTNLEYCAVFVN